VNDEDDDPARPGPRGRARRAGRADGSDAARHGAHARSGAAGAQLAVVVVPERGFPAWPDPKPSTGSRGGDVVAGATEGALAGAVIGLAVYQQSPKCAPADSPGESAALGAGTGAVWGGLRALFLGRNRMPPVLVNTPVRQEPRRAGTSSPPAVNDRCLGAVPPGHPDPTR